MSHSQNKGILLWCQKDGILSGFEGLDRTLFLLTVESLAARLVPATYFINNI